MNTGLEEPAHFHIAKGNWYTSENPKLKTELPEHLLDIVT
jgi:hypothetical protein